MALPVKARLVFEDCEEVSPSQKNPPNAEAEGLAVKMEFAAEDSADGDDDDDGTDSCSTEDYFSIEKRKVKVTSIAEFSENDLWIFKTNIAKTTEWGWGMYESYVLYMGNKGREQTVAPNYWAQMWMEFTGQQMPEDQRSELDIVWEMPRLTHVVAQKERVLNRLKERRKNQRIKAAAAARVEKILAKRKQHARKDDEHDSSMRPPESHHKRSRSASASAKHEKKTRSPSGQHRRSRHSSSDSSVSDESHKKHESQRSPKVGTVKLREAVRKKAELPDLPAHPHAKRKSARARSSSDSRPKHRGGKRDRSRTKDRGRRAHRPERRRERGRRRSSDSRRPSGKRHRRSQSKHERKSISHHGCNESRYHGRIQNYEGQKSGKYRLYAIPPPPPPAVVVRRPPPPPSPRVSQQASAESWHGRYGASSKSRLPTPPPSFRSLGINRPPPPQAPR